MTTHSWLRKLFVPSVTRPIRKAPPPTRLSLVGLEDRTAPVIDLFVATGGTLDVNPVSSIFPAGDYARMQILSPAVPGLEHGTMYKVTLTDAFVWGSGAPNPFQPASSPQFNQNRIFSGQGFRYVNDGTGLGETESIPVSFSNTTGTATTTDTLVIHINSGEGAPTITTQPLGLTMAVSGQTATLSVEATGAGTLNYQWYSGITPNASNPIPGATSSTFTTPVLSTGGQYMYWVKVSNAGGVANSLNATVNVSEATTTTTHSATVTYSRASQTVSMEATVTRTVPEWFGIANGAVTFAATGVSNTGNTSSTAVTQGLTKAAGVLTIPGRTHAGVYPLSAAYAGNIPLYLAESSDTNETLTILKADQTISGFGALPEKTYGDADFTIEGVSATSDPDAGGVVFTSLNPSVAIVEGNSVKIVGAGTAVIVASQAGNIDWNPAPNVEQTLVVRPATPTVTVAGGSFTYDQNAHTATATATGVDGSPVDGTLTFTYNGSATPPVNAGTYTVVAHFVSADTNYTDADSPAGMLVINPATPTVAVSGGPFTYDQNAHEATANATGAGGESVSGSFTFTYNGSATAPSEVGVYAVLATFTSADANYAAATGSGTLVINHAPPTDIALDNAGVAENQSAGMLVGVFSTTDLESGDTFTYDLVSGPGDADNAAFSLASDQLITSASFDFETKSSYSIRVRSTDASGLSTEKVFAISVTDVNETPTGIALSGDTVAENQPAGVVIGALSTTDPDNGDTHTYMLVSGSGGDDNASFSIDASGTLLTAAGFDFETKSSYSIRVRSTDAGGLIAEDVFTLNVSNVNETPTELTLNASSVAENQPAGTMVGTLSTSDADAGDSFTYSLVSGTGDVDNASFSIDANGNLLTASSFDFEAKSSYSIRVRSTDAGGLSTEMAFTIGVTDVNELPTISSNQTAVAVNEGSPATNSGTFDDPEGNGTVTLSASLGTVTPDAAGAWSWSHTPTDSLAGPIDVIITATDASGLTGSTTFTLTVANAEPTATLSSDGPVNEGSPATVNFSSPSDPSSTDTTAGFRYSFALSVADLATSYAAARTASAVSFTFADNGNYTVFGRIFDKDGGFTDATTTVVVNNVAPTITKYAVPVSGPEGSGVALVASATDPAGSDDPLSFVWTVMRPDSSIFTLTGGSVSFAPADEGSYGVSLTVSDGDGGGATQSSSIAVANVAPSIAISGSGDITEGAPYTLTLGAVSDPGSDTVSQYLVHWGDGSSDIYTTAGAKTHIYADGPATRAITVDMRDEDGTHANCANPLSVTVRSAALSAAVRGPSSGVRGQPRSFTVSAGVVSSADQAAGFVYTINWGDGSPMHTIARTAGNGSGVTVEHVYTASGKYTVTVTATDKDNATSPAASHTLSIVAVQMQGDDLVVGGTIGNEAIAITAGAKGTVKARVGGVSLGSFSPVGNIVVYGQAGNDKIQVANRVGLSAWLDGGEGNDTLRGTRNADVLMGGAGNDAIHAGAGIDDVDGGDGNDLLVGAGGADVLMGGAGNDAIHAGADNDWVDGRAAGDDVITGGSGHDTLFGGSGHDRVNGGVGRDRALGGEGNDTLTGSLGRDMLIGGLGADSLSGSGGDLLIAGTSAFDGNQEALDAIMTEWTSTRGYAARVANLKSLSGNSFLNVSAPDVTVFDDDAVDVLRGASGSNWYFANLSGGVLDTVVRLAPSEIVEELDILAP